MDAHTTIELHTGTHMPVLGLGTWQLTNNTVQAIEHSLELGYKMIDTSGDYGTQPDIGTAIKNSKVDRTNLYIVTKVEETDDAYEATKQNLRELQLEYADLVLIHRPPISGAGEALWRDLLQAQSDGLAKDIGVSNYSADQIKTLIDDSSQVPVVNQIEWSPFGYSNEMERFCETFEITIQAYSPLTRGKRLDDETLQEIAENYAKTPAQVLIRWNLQRGTVPLPKANQPEHQAENIDVFDFEISSEDMHSLNNLNEQYSSLGSLPYAQLRKEV